MLIYTILVTPFRIAYYDDDPLEWIIIDTIVINHYPHHSFVRAKIDSFFAIDIALNFVTAYFDQYHQLIHDRKKIAWGYLTGWFFIDLISIIPISLMLNSHGDYASLVRIARIPRLYRLIKMAKY